MFSCRTSHAHSNLILCAFSNQSNFQIQNLQQQLFAIAKQRDDAVTELARVRDRALQTETALNNLQLVLERLQRGTFHQNNAIYATFFRSL